MKSVKMYFFMSKCVMVLVAVMISYQLSAQHDTISGKETGYQFKEDFRLAATPVKNQYRSSTCWSFGTISLIESELIRMGKGTYDLSEMFVVRHVYAEKADRYVRRHGTAAMSAGGALPDAFYVLSTFGMVPEEAYSGKVIGEENHVHGEMDGVFKAYVDAVIANPNRKLTPVWKDGFQGLLDAYLGDYPQEFSFQGKTFTPTAFATTLGIRPESYIHLTSFTHRPFYAPFVIELPDNWDHTTATNLPLDELIGVIDHALAKGFTIAWGADISEKGFSHRNGVAIVPETNPTEMAGMERSRWEQLTPKEKDDMLYSFKNPVKEMVITPEARQLGYDNFTTTDDHAMHIIGIAHDRNGTRYYIVKNSWGTDNNPYGGYLYVSESFVRYKTISIILNIEAIPKNIRTKMKD
jgi:bleomycin hydrolase